MFSEKSYIEILDRSLLDTLDLVISMSTCILAYRPVTDDWILSIILDHGEEAQGCQ